MEEGEPNSLEYDENKLRLEHNYDPKASYLHIYKDCDELLNSFYIGK